MWVANSQQGRLLRSSAGGMFRLSALGGYHMLDATART